MPAEVAGRLERLLGARLREARRIGGQHGAGHYRVALKDGRLAFAKVTENAPGGAENAPGGPGTGAGAGPDPAARSAEILAAEASGLRWLAEPGVLPVPEVLGCGDGMLAIAWITQDRASPRSAERFGRDLARLHAAGPGRLGAPWPGYIAGLPLGNTGGPAWPQWYASERLLPFARRAQDGGHLNAADVRLVEVVAGRLPQLAGPAEPPSRIHGDCWSGNVLWSGGRGWLIDPAAHGGHRETDLAMLALFGAPWLDRILAAYREAAPLAGGWRARFPLHQLHPLLVHVCLFGAAYRQSMLDAARAALAG